MVILMGLEVPGLVMNVLAAAVIRRGWQTPTRNLGNLIKPTLFPVKLGLKGCLACL